MKELKRCTKIFALFITAMMWMFMNLTVVLYFHEGNGSIIGMIALIFCFAISSFTGIYYIMHYESKVRN